jgi:hypothetical protein
MQLIQWVKWPSRKISSAYVRRAYLRLCKKSGEPKPGSPATNNIDVTWVLLTVTTSFFALDSSNTHFVSELPFAIAN